MAARWVLPSLTEGRKLREKTLQEGLAAARGPSWNHTGVAARDDGSEAVLISSISLLSILLMGPFVLRSHCPPFPISRCACVFNRSPTDSPTPSHAPGAAGGPVETRCVSKTFIQTSHSFILEAKSLLSLAP